MDGIIIRKDSEFLHKEAVLLYFGFLRMNDLVPPTKSFAKRMKRSGRVALSIAL